MRPVTLPNHPLVSKINVGGIRTRLNPGAEYRAEHLMLLARIAAAENNRPDVLVFGGEIPLQFGHDGNAVPGGATPNVSQFIRSGLTNPQTTFPATFLIPMSTRNGDHYELLSMTFNAPGDVECDVHVIDSSKSSDRSEGAGVIFTENYRHLCDTGIPCSLTSIGFNKRGEVEIRRPLLQYAPDNDQGSHHCAAYVLQNIRNICDLGFDAATNHEDALATGSETAEQRYTRVEARSLLLRALDLTRLVASESVAPVLGLDDDAWLPTGVIRADFDQLSRDIAARRRGAPPPTVPHAPQQQPLQPPAPAAVKKTRSEPTRSTDPTPPPAPQPKPKIPDPIRPETREEKVQKLIRLYGAQNLLLGGDFPKIKEKLLTCDDGDYSHFADLAKEIFVKQRRAERRVMNRRRQELEIKYFELHPGTIKIEDFARQFEKLIPYKKEGEIGYDGEAEGYHPSVGPNFHSWRGGSEQEYLDIVERDQPIAHTSLPSIAYRNNVMDAKTRVEDELRENQERARLFSEEGRGATEEDLAKVRKFNRTKHQLTNVAESALLPPTKLLQWLGRGIISNSKASETDRYKEYLKRRNAALGRLAFKLAPDNDIYRKMLQRIEDFGTGDEMFDEASMGKIKELLLALAADSGKVSAAELEAANKSMEAANQAMLKGMQKFVDWEDNAMKFRLLHLALLLTPIGGFTFLAPEFFSWMDILQDLFGPMFDVSKGFSEGLGDIVTSDALGPLGDAADALGVDDTIEWVADWPLIENVGEIFDTLMDNDLTANLFGTIAPLVSSPLIPIVVAAVYSLTRVDQEVMHYCEVKKFITDQEAAMNKIVDGIEKKMGSASMEEKIAKFVTEKFKVSKQAWLDIACARFIGSALEEQLEVFNSFKFTDSAGAKKTFLDLKTGGVLDDRTALDYLCGSTDKLKIVDRFCLFKAAEFSPAKLTALEADSGAASKGMQAQKDALHQEYIFKLAEKKRMTSIQTKPADRAKDLEEQLIADEKAKIKRMYDLKLPRTAPNPTTPEETAEKKAAREAIELRAQKEVAAEREDDKKAAASAARTPGRRPSCASARAIGRVQTIRVSTT